MSMIAQPVAETLFEAYAPVVYVTGAAVVGTIGCFMGRYIHSLHCEIKNLNRHLIQVKANNFGLKENYRKSAQQVAQMQKELESVRESFERFKTPLVKKITLFQSLPEEEKRAVKDSSLYKTLQAVLESIGS